MENEETLKSRTLVCQLPDSVQNEVNYFFTDGVMASGVVVRSVLFASDELFWVKELSVCACPYFICKEKNWCLLTFFKSNFSKKLFQEQSTECQTVWIQVRTDVVGPALGPNCLQRRNFKFNTLFVIGN